VTVRVHELTLLDGEGERARIRVRCSAGTYVRSLAHDAGEVLGCGAHIEELRRTAMGEFTIEQAHTLEQVAELCRQQRVDELLVPPGRVLPEIPVEHVDVVTALQIAHGRDFRVSAFRNRQGASRIKAVDPDGRLVAIAEARLPLVYHPIVVL